MNGQKDFLPASQVPPSGLGEMTEKCHEIPGMRARGLGFNQKGKEQGKTGDCVTTVVPASGRDNHYQ